MADVGPDLGICHVCHQFCVMTFVDGAGYCDEHVPLFMDNEAMDMAFAKAGVPGPKRHGLFDALFFSTRQHKRRPKRRS